MYKILMENKMDSKLSVDCILRLIDLLTYDNEKLLVDKLMQDKIYVYKIYYQCSMFEIKFIAYARSENEAFEKLIPKISIERLRPYIQLFGRNYDKYYCHICMKTIFEYGTDEQNEETFINHKHDIEYEPEYFNYFIRQNPSGPVRGHTYISRICLDK